MPSIREQLLEIDVELEDYGSAIAKARNPSLTPEDRLKLIRASEASWKRLEAAHRQLKNGAIVVANDGAAFKPDRSATPAR
jgi:hypothetical protein